MSNGFHADAVETEVGVQEVPAVLVDLQRILAEQVVRASLVDVFRHRGDRIEGFPEADDAFVGVDLHPQHVRKFGEVDGFDGCYFHLVDFPLLFKTDSSRLLSRKWFTAKDAKEGQKQVTGWQKWSGPI